MPTERQAPEPPAEEQGAPKGPRQVGGTRIDETGRVTYTEEGAVSATPGGPLDPTIDPEAGQPVGTRGDGGSGVEMIDREDVPDTAGDQPPGAEDAADKE
jgi:hypothetical protein